MFGIATLTLIKLLLSTALYVKPLTSDRHTISMWKRVQACHSQSAKTHTALTTCPSEFCKQPSCKQDFGQLCASPVMPTGCCWLCFKTQSLYLSKASHLLVFFYFISESVFCFHHVSLMRGYKCLLTSLNESCQTTQP